MWQLQPTGFQVLLAGGALSWFHLGEACGLDHQSEWDSGDEGLGYAKIRDAVKYGHVDLANEGVSS